jgi:hypothetical protein
MGLYEFEFEFAHRGHVNVPGCTVVTVVITIVIILLLVHCSTLYLRVSFSRGTCCQPAAPVMLEITASIWPVQEVTKLMTHECWST